MSKGIIFFAQNNNYVDYVKIACASAGYARRSLSGFDELDPNETALIGQDITPITTDRGYIEAKLTSINPNFAAVIVDMLKESDIQENDIVDVAFTGSFHGLNIAVLSALQILHLKPLVITSLGASNWGANDPYFTWLTCSAQHI